jgi:hypothetical protein
LSLTASVAHESTIRKLVHRLGFETVDEIVRVLLVKARRERRFVARAMRCDSTVGHPAAPRAARAHRRRHARLG